MSTPVAMSPAEQIQRAVYARLQDDVDLRELVDGRVFDHVPETVVYPYVTVGDAVETPDNTLDGFGHQTVITLHVWSDYQGYAQALAVAGRIVSLFDHQPLPLDGHHTVVVRREQTRTLRDPDPRIRHVPVAFRVITEQE